jgi:hypothetical protein
MASVRLLQEARDVLSDPEKTLYDKWRGSGIAIGYKQWTAMKDSVQQVFYATTTPNFAFNTLKSRSMFLIEKLSKQKASL